MNMVQVWKDEFLLKHPHMSTYIIMETKKIIFNFGINLMS